MERIRDEIDTLTEDERECYAQGSDGKWRLDPDLAAELDAKDAELAVLQARIERTDAIYSRRVTRAAYRDALMAAGIDRGLMQAAIAMLAERAPVEPPGDDDAPLVARTKWGPLPVQTVVAQFLASLEGEVFAPKAATHGPFSERLRGLH